MYLMEERRNITPIDFGVIFKKIWIHRKTYYKVLPATLVITYLITVCVPRYYTCTVSLAPEPTGPSMSGSISSLASSFGLGSLSKMGNNDALYVEIYPDILKSNDFIAELMTVEVTTNKRENNITTNYYIYLRDYQSDAWWNVIKGKISEWIKPTPKDSYGGKGTLSVFNLTKQQSDIFGNASHKISCKVDKKTDVVSITVKDQDPLVCATMAKVTCQKLQEFIVKYRTSKAQIDYEYYKKLTDIAKADYEKVRRKYGATSDANMDVTMKSMELLLNDMENDMQLKYNIYTAMNTQLQAAAAKLQEATPAFTVIQSASIPVKPAGPKRMLISIGMMMMSFIALSIWLLVKNK